MEVAAVMIVDLGAVNLLNLTDFVDLQRLYAECNRRYFGDNLPKDVKLAWSKRLKRKAGTCEYNIYKYKDKEIVQDIKINLSMPYHRMNPGEIVETLVHEMIHIKHPYSTEHDAAFLCEMSRLNREFGLNISVFATGVAVVNYIYYCDFCGKEFHMQDALVGAIEDYCCSTCEGDLIERKVENESIAL